MSGVIRLRTVRRGTDVPRLRVRIHERTAGRLKADANRKRCRPSASARPATTGLGGDLPPDHLGPGTTRQVLCAKGSQCSPAAPTAPSAVSLPWTALRALALSRRAPTGEGVFSSGRERARVTSSVYGAGEERSARRRVGPWYPMTPVELVPSRGATHPADHMQFIEIAIAAQSQDLGRTAC